MSSDRKLTGWNGLGVAILALGCMTHAVSAQAQCSVSAWSSTTGTVQALDAGGGGKKYEQSCGMTVNAGTPGYVTTTAPTDEDFFTTRFYAYTAELDFSGGQAEIFTARDGANNRATLAVRESSSILEQELVLIYSNGSSDSVEHTQLIPILPVWQAFTVTWSTGSGDGSISVKINGTERMSVTSLNNAGQVVNEMDMGLVSVASTTGTAVFDAFETRRALPEPDILAVSEMRNISTRAVVGSGRLVVPAGFVIEGDTKKCVLIRARGQSINLTGRQLIQNPTLNLVKLGTNPPEQIEFNNDWQNHPLVQEIERSGRAPGDPSDAAIFACLDPGSYTATLAGNNNSPLGIGIVEVNDLDQGTPYLFNISTRAEVRNNFEKVVAGFIIEGTEPRRVLIRGRGQSINLNNITLLDDPQLLLQEPGVGVIETNLDWQDASNSADVVATGRAPNAASDSAILVQLQPGAYTVDLESETGTPGVGIVEVIDLDGNTIEAN